MTVCRLAIVIAAASLTVTCVGNAQRDSGVQFVRGFNWRQVRERAAAQHKYVFVDACGDDAVSCLEFDTSALATAEVGRYINAHFVSIRLSAVVATSGDASAASSYRAILELAKGFTSRWSPSLLFLSPNGILVQRGAGPSDTRRFLALAAHAIDPRWQYYSRLKAYQEGERDTSVMLYLVETARDIGETDVGSTVGRYYLDHSLGVRPLRELLNKPTLETVESLTRSGADSGFSLFYRHSGAIDSVMGTKGYASGVVERVVIRDEITPHLKSIGDPINAPPDWNGIRGVIATKYNQSIADSAIIDAQLRWYWGKQDWPNMVNAVVTKFERYGLDTTNPDGINDAIFNVIFNHSNDPAILAKAIRWMEIAMRYDPRNGQVVDTYANLLYKVGRTQEALRWEEKAVTLTDNGDVRENFAKMRRGEPTWPTDSSAARKG